MPSRSGEGKDHGHSYVHDSDLPRDYKPIIIERKNKFAAYDKNGNLINKQTPDSNLAKKDLPNVDTNPDNNVDWVNIND